MREIDIAVTSIEEADASHWRRDGPRQLGALRREGMDAEVALRRRASTKTLRMLLLSLQAYLRSSRESRLCLFLLESDEVLSMDDDASASEESIKPRPLELLLRDTVSLLNSGLVSAIFRELFRPEDVSTVLKEERRIRLAFARALGESLDVLGKWVSVKYDVDSSRRSKRLVQDSASTAWEAIYSCLRVVLRLGQSLPGQSISQRPPRAPDLTQISSTYTTATSSDGSDFATSDFDSQGIVLSSRTSRQRGRREVLDIMSTIQPHLRLPQCIMAMLQCLKDAGQRMDISVALRVSKALQVAGQISLTFPENSAKAVIRSMFWSNVFEVAHFWVAGPQNSDESEEQSDESQLDCSSSSFTHRDASFHNTVEHEYLHRTILNCCVSIVEASKRLNGIPSTSVALLDILNAELRQSPAELLTSSRDPPRPLFATRHARPRDVSFYNSRAVSIPPVIPPIHSRAFSLPFATVPETAEAEGNDLEWKECAAALASSSVLKKIFSTRTFAELLLEDARASSGETSNLSLHRFLGGALHLFLCAQKEKENLRAPIAEAVNSCLVDIGRQALAGALALCLQGLSEIKGIPQKSRSPAGKPQSPLESRTIKYDHVLERLKWASLSVYYATQTATTLSCLDLSSFYGFAVNCLSQTPMTSPCIAAIVLSVSILSERLAESLRAAEVSSQEKVREKDPVVLQSLLSLQASTFLLLSEAVEEHMSCMDGVTVWGSEKGCRIVVQAISFAVQAARASLRKTMEEQDAAAEKDRERRNRSSPRSFVTAAVAEERQVWSSIISSLLERIAKLLNCSAPARHSFVRIGGVTAITEALMSFGTDSDVSDRGIKALFLSIAGGADFLGHGGRGRLEEFRSAVDEDGTLRLLETATVERAAVVAASSETRAVETRNEGGRFSRAAAGAQNALARIAPSRKKTVGAMIFLSQAGRETLDALVSAVV